MQQLLLNRRTGETSLVDAPAPSLQPGHVRIRTECTLISAGTERMLVDFGRASILDRARQQPDKVGLLFDKMRTDGLMAAIDAVRSKLDQPLALGYCNVGTAIEVGAEVGQFRAGDRVVSNGSHAGIVSVPKNLCAAIPETVTDETAAFTVLGAVGLQGLRLAGPTLGETVVVAGLGLVGLMTVQMLRAHGCRVMGIDYNRRRLELAESFGAYAPAPSTGEETIERALEFSRGRGVDAVLITASTQSSELVSDAARMCRRRGRIVLVGVAGLRLSREDFYEKEITFQVSCSYGPGRYDPSYEEKGQDYPVGFVRWTEQRNFEAVLDLMAEKALEVTPLITHRFSIERAEAAYSVLTGNEPSLGILLEFPSASPKQKTDLQTAALDSPTVVLDDRGSLDPPPKPVAGCIGCGNFGGRILIPALVGAGAEPHTIVTANGLNAAHYGRKYGFRRASTSVDELLAEPEVNTVFIATRHDSHARLAAQALRSGRHVYVEKPLALTLDELAEVEAAYAEAVERGRAPILQVGFNRRFSPHVQRMRELLRGTEGPKSMTFLMNAGAIPGDHWTQDRGVGGGRILGEACHFIDLARYLAGAPVVEASACAMRGSGARRRLPDTAQISLEFGDGSIASIQYHANGHRSFPKERVEVFASGRILQLENFRVLRGYGWPGVRGFRSLLRTWKQNKGHAECVQAFIQAIRSEGPAPIPAEEIFDVSRVAIEVAEGLGCC